MKNINANKAAPTAYGSVQLGYVLVDSPRLQEWQRFVADGIGMEIAASALDTLAFRVDDRARRLVVRKSGNEDVTLGWQVKPEALDLILQRLRRREIGVETAEGEQAALRGVRKLWRFLGPKRQVFELFSEPLLDGTPPKVKASGFVTGERGLGHVAITTRKPKEMIAFWQEIFDAKISDFIDDRISGINLHFTFMRVNPRHHSVAVAATKGLALDPFRTKIQHVEMQVADINDVTDAYRRLRELGFKIAMAVGQHTNDRDVSFYAVTPSEFYFELGWCSAGEHDIETWPQVAHKGISLWGHKPQDQTIGEKLAQVGRGVSSLFRPEYTPF
ncbi:MAG TPA: VOC family protein [Candidatus Margulisiibacteriota bacterium]|nr:VOC family protein [Candidatus Margulisiibacteriota bacterium]